MPSRVPPRRRAIAQPSTATVRFEAVLVDRLVARAAIVAVSVFATSGGCASLFHAHHDELGNFEHWTGALTDVEHLSVTREEAESGQYPDMHCPTAAVCNENNGGIDNVSGRLFHLSQPDWASYQEDPQRYCEMAARSERAIARYISSAIELAPDRSMAWLQHMPFPQFAFGPLADLHVQAAARLQDVLRANQSKLGRPFPNNERGCVLSDKPLAEGGLPTTSFGDGNATHVYLRCYNQRGKSNQAITREINLSEDMLAYKEIVAKGDMVEFELSFIGWMAEYLTTGTAYRTIALHGDGRVDTSTDYSEVYGLPPGALIYHSAVEAAADSAIYFAPMLVRNSNGRPRLNLDQKESPPSAGDLAACNAIAKRVFAQRQ